MKQGLEAQEHTTKEDLRTAEERVSLAEPKMTMLEDHLDKLHERFVYATIKEKALQDINDTTNSRVAVLGILTVLVVLIAGMA